MKAVYGMLIGVVVGIAAMPLQAQGVLLVQKETRNGQSTTNQVQIDRNHMRAESLVSGDQTAFVFDGPGQTVRMINLTKKTYLEMTKSDMEQMRERLSSAMAQMQEQLKNLPPEQRQAIEQMMRGRGGMPGMGAAPPRIEYRAAGSDKVGQWTCTKYEGYLGQQKTMEICTVDPKQFGLTPADFEVAAQLAEFMKSLAPEGMDRLFVNGTVQDQGFTGIPIRRTSYRNGVVDSVNELTEFKRMAFPPSTFDIPAGFSKQAMPGMPGGR